MKNLSERREPKPLLKTVVELIEEIEKSETILENINLTFDEMHIKPSSKGSVQKIKGVKLSIEKLTLHKTKEEKR